MADSMTMTERPTSSASQRLCASHSSTSQGMETDKPQSLKAPSGRGTRPATLRLTRRYRYRDRHRYRKLSDVFACPPPARNSFSRRDAEPAEVGIPFMTAFLDARGGTAQTRDQGSGVGKEGGSHPSTAAGSGPADSPSHPDHSKWNCPSNAMAGCSGPSTDFHGSLPLIRHGHRCGVAMGSDLSV